MGQRRARALDGLSLVSDFAENGWRWYRQALEQELVERIKIKLSEHDKARLAPADWNGLVSSHIAPLIKDIMPGAFPVGATLFHKSAKQTWSLGWHQDRVIPVMDKQSAEGFKNWTRKAGQWHCEPPIELLAKMMFVQIYLDDVDIESGPTELAIGSHKLGKLLSNEIGAAVAEAAPHICLARAGDVLAVHALTVHRSRRIETIAQRRIIRIDLANFALPENLDWPAIN